MTNSKVCCASEMCGIDILQMMWLLNCKLLYTRSSASSGYVRSLQSVQREEKTLPMLKGTESTSMMFKRCATRASCFFARNTATLSLSLTRACWSPQGNVNHQFEFDGVLGEECNQTKVHDEVAERSRTLTLAVVEPLKTLAVENMLKAIRLTLTATPLFI